MADTARRALHGHARPSVRGGAGRGPGGRPAAPAAQADAQPPIVDVWSRTAIKYRARAIVLLVVDVVLFGGLCTFAYWLRTGALLAPAQANYWAQLAETFHPSRDTSVSLGSLLTFPISVEEVPLQIVILGLLLAALVSIPILVSILYRFPASLAFVSCVAFLAMMPWLAITITGSCVLASVRPFRLKFRYASALLGLVLVLAYFYGAARTVSPAVAVLANPADRIKFIAPWLLATVAACVVMGFVLLIARMVNYRPGAIAPLLAMMFALPVALFEFYVGRDELHYRIIEHDYGPSSAYFAERDISAEFERAVRAAWESRAEPRPALDTVRDNAELAWALSLAGVPDPYATALAEHRHAAVDKIDWFLRHYPDSRYVVNALYLKATALDMRADPMAFSQDKVLRFYSSLPAQPSWRSWRMVVENGPRTPMAAVALHRLAMLEAQAGDLDGALARLDTLVKTFGESSGQAGQSADTIKAVLTRKPVEVTLGISIDRHLLEGVRLRDLLRNNRDPLYGDEPLVRFLRFDPRSSFYADNLREMIERYPRAQITDNARLELALAAPSVRERVAALEQCAADFPDGDAAAEIGFRLGETFRESQVFVRAREAYERVVRDHPDSVWARLAREHLRVLPTTPPPAGA